ncbi:MAG: hypothetical protein AVDCRST_MAG47-662, partial [uncultured Nocardioidaceae bacterium]
DALDPHRRARRHDSPHQGSGSGAGGRPGVARASDEGDRAAATGPARCTCCHLDIHRGATAAPGRQHSRGGRRRRPDLAAQATAALGADRRGGDSRPPGAEL